jgi:hypothetical protein
MVDPSPKKQKCHLWIDYFVVAMRRRNKWNNMAIVEWDNSFGGMEQVIEE